MNENVPSMRPDDRANFTRHLGVRPVRAGISQARRERYYWLSWPVPPAENVERRVSMIGKSAFILSSQMAACGRIQAGNFAEAQNPKSQPS